MNSLRWLSSLLPLAALVAAAAAPQPPYRISGIVVSETTGAPIPQCHIVANRERDVRATPSGPASGPASGPGDASRGAPGGGPGGMQNRRFPTRDSGVDTDEHGRFVLPVSGPGTWSLRASARGYRSQGFEQHENFSTSVVITDQTPAYDLTYRLIPDSTITGIILDEAGEPVRQAQVTVYALPRAGTANSQPGMARSNGMTDDRGRYEVIGLAPGDYRLSVQARPWYASNLGGRPPIPNTTPPSTSQLDPSLDVVYPVTWFPGTTDENAAVTLTLHDGETREAGVQLVAIPAIQLRLPAPLPPSASQPGVRPPNRNPQIERVSGNGIFMPVSMNQDGQGHLDINGLSPGLYRITTPGENGEPAHSTIVEISSGSSRSVDLASTIAPTATVTLKMDGSVENENLPIVFTDATNSSRVFRTVGRGGPSVSGGFRGGPPSGPGNTPAAPSSSADGQRPARYSRNSESGGARPDRTIDLPPGRYYVNQAGSNEIYLTGMALGTQQISGRMVTIPSGSSVLTLHIATGRATLSGIATLTAGAAKPTGAARPSIGAMILLVPITLNEPGAISILRRAQTNTDGSFHLSAVIPGQYILVAIDRGWGVNWNDAMTLNRYLSNGVPLDLHAAAVIQQDVAAQTP